MNPRSFSFSPNRLTIGAAILALFSVLALGVSRWLFPFDEGHYEGGIWAPSLLMARGVNPYGFPQIENPPYTMAPYGPLSYLIFGIGLRVFGLQFQSGRAICLVALLVCAACIAWLTYRATQQKRLAWLAVALFLSQQPVLYWTGVQRPDFLALALGLSAICLSFRVIDERTLAETVSTRRCFGLALCALLAASAILTRLTTFLPLIFVLYRCLSFKGSDVTRRKSRFAELRFMSAVAAIFLIAVFGALNVTSGGGFWWQSWVLANMAPRSLTASIGQTLGLLASSPATILALCLVALAWRKALSTSDSPSGNGGVRAFSLLSLAAFTVAFATSARAGSDLNYWIEPTAYLSVAAAIAWPHLADETQRLWRVRYAFCLVVVALSATLSTLPLWQEEQLRWAALPYLRRVVSAIERNSQPDEPCFGLYVDLIHAAKRTPFFNDAVQYDKRSHYYELPRRMMQKREFAVVLSTAAPLGYRRIEIPSELSGQYVRIYARDK